MNPSMLLGFPVLWLVGGVAAYLYAQERGIPWSTALAVLPAFLLEVSLYYTLGVEGLRARLEKLPLAGLAGVLTIAAALPYSMAALALGTFSWSALAWVVVLAGMTSFWYVLLPHRPATDV